MESALEDILQAKGWRVTTADCADTIRHGVQLMNSGRIGAVVVTQARRVVGIFTERDVLRRVVDRDIDLGRPLREVMTSPVQCAPKSMRAAEAMQMMTLRRHRHLPVVDDSGSPLGIVSIGDLMLWATRELEQSVVDLSAYICGPACSVSLPPTHGGSRVLLHAP